MRIELLGIKLFDRLIRYEEESLIRPSCRQAGTVDHTAQGSSSSQKFRMLRYGTLNRWIAMGYSSAADHARLQDETEA